jgi:cell division GTPase FtsZ
MKYVGYSDPEKRVGAIVTLPTVGESASPLVSANAYKRGIELSELADSKQISPLIVIDNDRIRSLYKGLTVGSFYPTINNTIAQMFHVFNTIATQPSEYITFDATDFISVLQCGGHLIMGVTTIANFQERTGISTALKNNLTRTLLASDFDLSTAKVAAVIVVAGREIINTVNGLMDNIDYGFDTIAQITGNATIHRGIYADDASNKVRVFTMISGLAAPMKRYERLR